MMSRQAQNQVRPRLPLGDVVYPSALYVPRPEDRILESNIRNGTWTNVVAPRTMGKTSLFVKILRDLRTEGFLVSLIDLVLDSNQKAKESDDPMEMFICAAQNFELSFKVIGSRPKEEESQIRLKYKLIAEQLMESNPSDADKFWCLIQAMLEGSGGQRMSSQKIVLCIDEIQYLAALPCGARFVEAMNAVAEKISHSDWNDRVTLVFIGWEAFGGFAPNKAPFIAGRADIVELKDWRIDDGNTINILAQALDDSDDAKEAVRIALQRAGGQPLTTCLMLREILVSAELGSTTYRDAAERPSDLNLDCLFDIQASIRSSNQAVEAEACLKELLRSPNGSKEFDNEPIGMKILLTQGVVRKRGNVYEVKSPLHLDWFRDKYEVGSGP